MTYLCEPVDSHQISLGVGLMLGMLDLISLVHLAAWWAVRYEMKANPWIPVQTGSVGRCSYLKIYSHWILAVNKESLIKNLEMVLPWLHSKVTGHVPIYDVAFVVCVISFVATLSQCEVTINFSFNRKKIKLKIIYFS